MKAQLKFNLDVDHDAFMRAAKADDLAFALHEILMNMRKRLEWQDLDEKTIDAAVEFVHDTAHDFGINIEDLVH